MRILQTLKEIRNNKDTFKNWESEQRNNKERRQQLYNQKPPTAQEQKQAQDKGKIILDAINVMDQHSEDVAQNIETAAQIPMALIPISTLAGSGYAYYKLILEPNGKKIQKLEDEFLSKNNDKISNLIEQSKQDSYKKFQEKGRFGDSLYKYDFLKPQSFNHIDCSASIKEEGIKIAKEWEKIKKPIISKNKYGAIIPIATTIIAFVGGNIIATNLEVKGSKISRYQSRNMLNDPKYFVNYTPEQIAEAQKKVDAMTKEEKQEAQKDKLSGGMFKSISGVIKNNKDYKEWKNNDKDDSKIVSRELTQDEINDAKKDKDIIQRTIKEINNAAEQYSQNMEVAADVLIGGTPFLGAGVGLGVNWFLKKTGLLNKFLEKNIKAYGSEEALNAFKEYKKIEVKDKNSKRAYLDFVRKFKESKLPKGKTYASTKKTLISILSSNAGSKKVIAMATAFITTIPALVIGLKLEKSAARAGRYSAKKELEKNPQSFIGYTDEDYNKMEDIKDNSKKESKLKTYALFLPNVFKQYFAYKKYKKTELSNQKLLQEKLKESQISNEQMKEAKNMQRKLFNTFEKVDDKSQTYSENTEAAIEIAKPFVLFSGIALAVSPFIITAIMVAKGKLNLQKVAEKIIDKLSKSTNVMNKKWFKKYLNNVAQNTSHKINSVFLTEKPIGNIIKDVDLNNDTLIIIDKLEKNIRNMDSKEFNHLKYDISSMFENISHIFKGQLNANMTEKINEIKKLLNSKGIYNLKKEDIANTISQLKQIPDINKIKLNNLNKVLSGLKEKSPFKLDIKSLIQNNLKKRINSMSDEEIAETMNELARGLESNGIVKNLDVSKMDKKFILNTSEKLIKIIDNIPKEETKKIMSTFLSEMQKNPDETIAFIKSGNAAQIFMTPGLKATIKAAGISWTVATLLLTYTISSWLADIKLKAGRLGVMGALNDLNDPRYYANPEK